MAGNNRNKKFALKVCLTLVLPTVLVFTGSGLFLAGVFKETIMQRLFPAMIFGFLYVYATKCTLDHMTDMILDPLKALRVGQIIAFVSATILYLLGFMKLLIVGLIIWSAVWLFLVIMKRIAGL